MIATGEVIRAEHVEPGAMRGGVNMDPAPLATLQTLEHDHIRRVLAATSGHKARAAQILGVSRPRLDRLLRKYGIH
jgi:DNA-binding NtrC family response regulator